MRHWLLIQAKSDQTYEEAHWPDDMSRVSVAFLDDVRPEETPADPAWLQSRYGRLNDCCSSAGGGGT